MRPECPRISVVICTHNRVQYLEKALQSLVEQTLRSSDFEVIVVDNASTDGTAELVHRLSAEMPNLRYLHEVRLGLSVARNTGAAACRSPFVAYLDDDARAFPPWLQAILEAFETVSPAPACVGGPIHLDWEGAPPAWLPVAQYSWYSQVDWGPKSRFLSTPEHLVGANMAFGRDVMSQLGGFSTSLGRKGTSLLSGEDSELLSRIKALGLPVFYAADAAIWHTVARQRQNRRWLFGRIYWGGVAGALQQEFRDGPPGLSRPRRHLWAVQYDVRTAVLLALKYCLRLCGDRDIRFQYLVDLLSRLGMLRTHWSLACGGESKADSWEGREREPLTDAVDFVPK